MVRGTLNGQICSLQSYNMVGVIQQNNVEYGQRILLFRRRRFSQLVNILLLTLYPSLQILQFGIQILLFPFFFINALVQMVRYV